MASSSMGVWWVVATAFRRDTTPSSSIRSNRLPGTSNYIAAGYPVQSDSAGVVGGVLCVCGGGAP